MVNKLIFCKQLFRGKLLTSDLHILALVEEEKQRIEQMAADWDDPTSLDWGAAEEKDEVSGSADGSIPAEGQPQIYKCTALYSYTVQNSLTTTIFNPKS